MSIDQSTYVEYASIAAFAHNATKVQFCTECRRIESDTKCLMSLGERVFSLV